MPDLAGQPSAPGPTCPLKAKGQLDPRCAPRRLIPWTRAPPRGRGPAALLPRELSVPAPRPEALRSRARGLPGGPRGRPPPRGLVSAWRSRCWRSRRAPRGRVDGGRPGQANEPREGAEAGGPALATGCAPPPPPLQDWPGPAAALLPPPGARRPGFTQGAPSPPCPAAKLPSRTALGRRGLPCPPSASGPAGLSDQRTPAPSPPAVWVRCGYS